MDWLELAKTVGSAAGLGTLAWRGYDAWDAHRDRLKVRSTLEHDHQLDLLISYRAKSEHTGFVATVEVLAPAVGEVLLLRPRRGPELTREQAVEWIMAREVIGNAASAAMVLSADQTGLFELAGQVFTNDGTPKAKVRVTIRDQATGRRVMRLTKPVSPSRVA